jgi:hypothetical protein
LFWCHYRRTHQETPVFTSTIVTSQATATPYATPLLKILRHRFGSEPPTGTEDDGYILADASFCFIFGPSATFFFHEVFCHFKSTHVEALPLHYIHASRTPLLQLAGALSLSGDYGSSSRVLVVIGSFYKGLNVRLLL